MKKSSTLFLRGVIIVLGLLALAFSVIALPLGILTDNVGYYRPLLIGLYLPVIPFFIALYQATKLLGYIEKNNAFSNAAVESLNNIKYCAITISGLFTVGMPYIFYVGDRDDAPGVILIALVFIFASFVIAVFAAVLKRILQNAIEIKSENDLTV